jgi:hypothetical protein
MLLAKSLDGGEQPLSQLPRRSRRVCFERAEWLVTAGVLICRCRLGGGLLTRRALGLMAAQH